MNVMEDSWQKKKKKMCSPPKFYTKHFEARIYFKEEPHPKSKKKEVESSPKYIPEPYASMQSDRPGERKDESMTLPSKPNQAKFHQHGESNLPVGTLWQSSLSVC